MVPYFIPTGGAVDLDLPIWWSQALLGGGEWYRLGKKINFELFDN